MLKGSNVRPAGESEVAVPVQMELKRIIISEIHEQQVVMLKEVDGERSFSIMIGIFEATSIDRRVTRLPSPRPLTHDLVANVVEQLGGEISDIYISELRDHTYYAKLRSRHRGQRSLGVERSEAQVHLHASDGPLLLDDADVGRKVAGQSHRLVVDLQ